MGYLLGLGVVHGAGKMFGILSQLNAVQSSSERDSDATAWSASGAVQCHQCRTTTRALAPPSDSPPPPPPTTKIGYFQFGLRVALAVRDFST